MSGWWVTLYCEDTLYACIESYQTVWLWFLFVICCQNYEPENKNEDDVGDRNSDDNDGGDKETFEVEIDREKREEDGGWDCYDHYLQHGQHQPGKQKTAEFAAWSNDEKYVSWDVHTSNTQSDQTTLLNTLYQSIYEGVQLLSAGLVKVAVVGDQVEPGQASLEEADAGVRDGVVGDVGVLHDVVGGDVDVAEDEGGKERSW